ncbi:MAG: TIGR02391 family protein [Actinobacteria bacterium]|nr:TIGR02391 family protein [Actinomycetota bacterium]
MKWIKEMDNYNFLGIYDVILDIKTEINISSDRIVIPLLQNRVKFYQLFPIDSIGTRDKYCELRYKATKFLKKNRIIKDFKLIKEFDRWESKLEIQLEKKKIESVFNKMKMEHEKRISKDSKQKPDTLNTFWGLIHPKIVEVSKSRFETNHFADSVEAALKEVNNIVKGIVKQSTGKEYDGADLMNRAFSLQNPIIVLDDLSTETGKAIQIGYMQIFSGSMTGIRNPKAHQNITIDEKRTIHFLFLASLLMFKIDEKK